MLKRKPVLFFTLVFAIVALFAATQVVAQQLPLTCSDGTFTMTPAPGDFPRFDAAECGGTHPWVWEYTISTEIAKTMSSLTKVHFAARSYPPQILSVSAEHVSARGGGGVSTTHGDFVYDVITISVTPPAGGNTNQKSVSFCTDSQQTGMVSPSFDGAKFLRGCESVESDGQGPLGGIIGPGFAPVLPSREASSQTFTVTEGDLTCTIVSVQGSPPTVTATGDCELGGINGVKRLNDIVLDGNNLVTFPFNVWVKAHGSPGSFTYCYPNGYCVVFNF